MKFKVNKHFFSAALSYGMAIVMSMPTFASTIYANDNVTSQSQGAPSVIQQNVPRQLKLEYVTPEEMDRLVKLAESNVQPYNWIEDRVTFTLSRKGNACYVVFLNTGFMFDRVDVTGRILLHAVDERPIGKWDVYEPKLVYMVPRSNTIISTTGDYMSYVSYTLTISDGDIGTTYSGIEKI